MTTAAVFSPIVPTPKPVPRRDLLRRYLIRALLRERGALGLKLLLVRVFPSSFLTGGLHAMLILRKRVWGGMAFDEQAFELASEAVGRPFDETQRRILHGNQLVRQVVGALTMVAMLAWLVGMVQARGSILQLARALVAGPPVRSVEGIVFISAVSLAYAIITLTAWQHAKNCAKYVAPLGVDYKPKIGATIPFAASMLLLFIGAWWTIPATIAWGMVWWMVGIDSNRWSLPLGRRVQAVLMGEIKN